MSLCKQIASIWSWNAAEPSGSERSLAPRIPCSEPLFCRLAPLAAAPFDGRGVRSSPPFDTKLIFRCLRQRCRTGVWLEVDLLDELVVGVALDETQPDFGAHQGEPLAADGHDVVETPGRSGAEQVLDRERLGACARPWDDSGDHGPRPGVVGGA